MGSSVVSFKVSEETKKRMDKYRKRVNWPQLLREFVEAKLTELEAEEALRKTEEILTRTNWSTPRGEAVRLLREDRESR